MKEKPLRPGEFRKAIEKLDNKPLNLNDFIIPSDRYFTQPMGIENYIISEDNSVSLNSPKFDSVETHFRNIEDILIKKILEYKNELIIGCVAWLTSYKILDALAKCKNVQIVVQKEDFLRPDLKVTNQSNWKKVLHEKYGKVSCEIERHQFKYPMGSLSVAGDPTVDGIRCVGNHNSEKVPAFPRMHNKFLIFCKTQNAGSDDNFDYKPVSVWTGSFNLTQNATYSIENAISLNDSSGQNEIINSYLKEHHQIFCISEKLNWDFDWVEPEFRIGT